jgi:chromosome partitioning protein
VRTIAIINQKGGCGKTTTAINLAGVFSRSGLRTLLVDLDPQSHCAAGLAIPEQRIDVSIGDAMVAPDNRPIDWSRLLWRVSRNLDLAPSTVRLAGLESARGGLASTEQPERRLLSVVSRLADQYDCCLIDCPPAIGLLTYNALVAATEVLIPVETAFLSLQGASKQVSTIKALSKRLGASAPFRLLPTMHNPESPLSRDLLDELQRRFESRVIPVVIRFDHALREAVSFGQPVIEYAPHSHGAEDYVALGRHLIEHPADKSQRREVDDTIAEPKPGAFDHGAAFDLPISTGPGTANAPQTTAPTAPITVRPGAAESVLTASSPARVPAVAAAVTAETTPTPAAATTTTPIDAAALLSRAADLASRAQKLAARVGGPAPAETSTAVPTMAAFSKARSAARDTAGAIAAIYGVRLTSSGVLFVQPASIGTRVAIAGEFNGWSAEASPMTLNPTLGVFEACLPLPVGRFQYRLVVDGQWIPDPANPETAPNPFGEPNSIINVTYAAALSATA